MAAPTTALELTGAGLVVVTAAGVLASEPACACFERDAVLTGHAARARARLAPLFTVSRHLEEPSTEPLPRQRAVARSPADLVYAQLAALPDLAGRPLLLAVSGAYSVDQLGLLLGVAAAAGLDVAGVVDAAVAAAAAQPSTPRALHLDLDMHRAVLTELIRADGVRRGRVDIAASVGLRAFDDAAAQLIARSFVRATRFDPLHQAPSEQALYDALPGCLAALLASGGADVVLEHGGLRHETRIDAAQLVAALAPLAAEITRLVHSARRAGERVTLYATARVAALPGLVAALGALRDCELVVLGPGSAGAGALAAAAEIAGPEPALVGRLQAAAPLSAVAAPPERTGLEAPTHLIHLGRAHALGAEPLVVGRAPCGARTLAVAGELAGVSRSHCVLAARGGEAVLEDLSSYGTFLNGERVERRARLAAGDRVRVGTPGIEFELVRLDG